MSAEIKELINEHELEILTTALEQYERRCRSIADQPIRGYGTASEFAKKEDWRAKAEEIRELTGKIAAEFI